MIVRETVGTGKSEPSGARKSEPRETGRSKPKGKVEEKELGGAGKYQERIWFATIVMEEVI